MFDTAFVDQNHGRSRTQLPQTCEWRRDMRRLAEAQYVSPKHDIITLSRHCAESVPSHIVIGHHRDTVCIETYRDQDAIQVNGIDD
jgi:hypothetical protein